MPSLGVAIMGVPERRSRQLGLLKKLGLTDDFISTDVNHQGHVFGWWQAVELAKTKSLTGTPPTHLLIIEDDAEPCLEFLAAAQKLVELYPDRTISFYSNRPVVEEARQRGDRLVQVEDVPNDVAVVYPLDWINDLQRDYQAVASSFERSKRRWGYGADEMRWELRPNKVVWTTSPSLVQHGAPESSTLGHRFPSSVARWFIGHNVSALSIDWEQA